VDWYEFTDVSEVCTASIIGVRGATTQKTAIFKFNCLHRFSLCVSARFKTAVPTHGGRNVSGFISGLKLPTSLRFYKLKQTSVNTATPNKTNYR
jgi:hypothetical protein